MCWLINKQYYINAMEAQFYKNLITALKVRPSISKKICVICLIESPLKMIKNVFYFITFIFISINVFICSFFHLFISFFISFRFEDV